MPSWLLLAFASHAQTTPSGHITVPSSGVATEDGPGAGFVNPANLAYDPDPRFGLFFDRPVTDGDVSAFAAAGGFSGLNLAVQNSVDPLAVLHWEAALGTSVKLPSRFAIGANARWRMIPRRPNVVAFDGAVSWRPAPWFGASFVAKTIGRPDVTGRIVPTTHYGIALRPHKAVTLGLEQIVIYDGSPDFLGRANLRVRATEGLYLRAHFESDPDFEVPSGGGAVEFMFGGTGIALGARSDGEQTLGSGWIGTGEPGESLIRGKRQVAVTSITRAPSYAPARGLFSDDKPSWLETLHRLQQLENDKQCEGVLLTMGSAGLGLARQHELRARIEALESAGKSVTVYLTGSIDTANYYTASAASRILMHPAAVLDLTGIGVELQHYRGLMDMVGVQAQVVRRSEFKSAAESFSNDQPSPENLEQLNALLDDLYAEITRGIAAGRDLEASAVAERIDGGPYLAAEALETKLIDEVLYPDRIERSVGKQGALRLVKLNEGPQDTLPWETNTKVAVIYVDGTINTGSSSKGGLLSSKSAGSRTLVRQLDRARRDSAVKAVVLRVDSPGGSAFASDEILRAVERYENKPLVVSMGGLAASGGYYVASKADSIWAAPTTLTGSIGVVSFKLSANPLFDSLGVGNTRLERGANAGINSSYLPWDEAERARSQALVDGIYDQFKAHVAAGRGMELDAVETVARGRVWSGTQAAENGLVDRIGGLLDAIDDAKQRAGLSPKRTVTLETYAPQGNLVDQLNPLPAIRAGSSEVPALLKGFEPVVTFALHPEEKVWMMEPWIQEVK